MKKLRWLIGLLSLGLVIASASVLLQPVKAVGDCSNQSGCTITCNDQTTRSCSGSGCQGRDSTGQGTGTGTTGYCQCDTYDEGSGPGFCPGGGELLD